MLLTPNDRLRTAPRLRKSRLCILADAGLLAVIVIAILIHLGLLAGMAADVVRVFLRALAISTALVFEGLRAAMDRGDGLAVRNATRNQRYRLMHDLDRRERETPCLFAASFLWGGFIATAVVLPFNTAFFHIVDRWVALNPVVTEILGPDATTLIAAPLSAPIAEELAKAAGVALTFGICMTSSTICATGLSTARW